MEHNLLTFGPWQNHTSIAFFLMGLGIPTARSNLYPRRPFPQLQGIFDPFSTRSSSKCSPFSSPLVC